ncbi:MAG: putative MFS-type transporter YnfM [Rhodanobacteraceae bacterium]|jgi:YNFM family putative membrane transporter|nr:MAG: putative MFS-type transporter YnfM [Rhodanobacteraceae bacterium]
MDTRHAPQRGLPPQDFIHHGTPEFRRVNWALFAAGFATFGLLYCVQPLLPEFSRDYGVSEAVSALSLSLTTFVLAFGMLFAGALSDAWGRKPVMVGSLVSSALLVLVSAWMPDWTALLFVRALLGLTLSGLPAVAMTYLAEEMDIASIGLGMGLYISGNAIGGMSGRLITGVLTDFAGWRVGVTVVAAIGVACALAFWRLLPPSRHFKPQPLHWRALGERLGVIFRDRGLPWLFAEGFLLLGAFVTIYNYIGYRLLAPPYNLSQAAVGAIFVIYLIGTFSSPWVGHLAGKLGRRKVLWTMLALMLAGTLLTAFSPLWAVLLGVIALTFGFFGGHSVVSSWVGRRAGAAKAHASSLYLFCYYMGSSIAGACGGLFYAADGWNGIIVFVGAMTLAGLAIALGLYRLPPLPQSTATPPTPMSRGAMP